MSFYAVFGMTPEQRWAEASVEHSEDVIQDKLTAAEARYEKKARKYAKVSKKWDADKSDAGVFYRALQLGDEMELAHEALTSVRTEWQGFVQAKALV